MILIGPESGEITREKLQVAAGTKWNHSVLYRGVLDREALYAEYRGAAGLILASHKENFGHVVAEAMRFGLPVIISEDVDLCTVVSTAAAGLVVPVHSENDIFEALATFLQLTPDELERFGQAARSVATKCFGFQAFANSYRTILETHVSQAAKPANNRVLQTA